jgi:hypothetical protein
MSGSRKWVHLIDVHLLPMEERSVNGGWVVLPVEAVVVLIPYLLIYTR